MRILQSLSKIWNKRNNKRNNDRDNTQGFRWPRGIRKNFSLQKKTKTSEPFRATDQTKKDGRGPLPDQINPKVDCRVKTCMLDDVLLTLSKCRFCPLEDPQVLTYLQVDVLLYRLELASISTRPSLPSTFYVQLRVVDTIINRLQA